MTDRFIQAWLALFAFLKHGSLTWELTKREVLGRYRGASLGMIWALLVPVLMVVVYSVAFGEIMRAKWPGLGEGTTSFALILFVGLIVHGIFAECLIRAPMLVVSNPNYVTRMIFPVEILPWPMIVSALFHLAMNFIVFMLACVVLEKAIPWTIMLLPLVLFPLVVLIAGMAWYLAALGVYFRDINQVTGPVATAMLFLSSAIVPVDVLPESYQTIFYLNPLTFIIDEARDVALWGIAPDWTGLTLYLVLSTAFAYTGSLWFQSTRKGFADVL